MSDQPKLKKCPAGGQGVHRWIYYAACKCVDAGLDDAAATALMEPLLTRAQTPSDEIESALASARNIEKKPTQHWPIRNFPKIKIIRMGRPIQFSNDVPDAEKALDMLFPGNPLLCIGLDSSRFTTKPRERWRGHVQYNSLIVPSPMSAVQGVIKKKGPKGETLYSMHSLDNTGERRYIVIELDWGDTDTQAKILRHLSKHAPLCAIVSSGGKSLHGWYFFKGISEPRCKEFMSYAVSLGADPHTWLKSQFVRLPGGRRDNGAHQKILYWNRKHILDCPENFR